MADFRLTRVASAFAVALLVVGCARGGYQPPTAASIRNETVVDRPFDQTWDALVRMTAQTFFAIDNFERASGLITLSFGADNIARFVDCGQFETSGGVVTFSGPWATFVERYAGATLNGRMNLLVQREGANRTRVRVSARYILTIPELQAPNQRMLFSFDSTGQATVPTATPVAGSNRDRTCRPTGEAERTILNAVSG